MVPLQSTENIAYDSAPLTHRAILSSSNPSGSYFDINLAPHTGSNPNIIPHPLLPSIWIVVAQQQRSSVKNTVWFAELVCDAVFNPDNSSLQCIPSSLVTLPIAATYGDRCEGDLNFFSLNIGPHDTRVFYGPKSPFAIYGSQSGFTCFGQWLQNFRMLLDWGLETLGEQQWRRPTELQRPTPYRPIEKNWFIFWDVDGQMYAHYDVAPRRVFAQLHSDGSVGLDLAPAAAAVGDEQCLSRHMPQGEIHQATNSLSITMCARDDQSCTPTYENTFIMMIFQQKTLHGFHSVYEPYVMLFRQWAPFEVYAISRKPLWIYGRKRKSEAMIGSAAASSLEGEAKPEQGSQMFYITSIAWKTQGQKYYGYLSDELFIAFGIEDSSAAAIDVRAADILPDLVYCSEV
ncbi:hypothetical protein ACLMJK_002856 [Lecanora helva]